MRKEAPPRTTEIGEKPLKDTRSIETRRNTLKPIAEQYWINQDKLKYIENNHHQDPTTTTKNYNNTKIGGGWLETNIDFPSRTTTIQTHV